MSLNLFRHVLSVLFITVLSALPLRAIDLTLATFNIRYDTNSDRGWRTWSKREARVIATIRQMNPDVLAVQEALHNQVADLQRALPEYEYFGAGRDDGKKKGESCGIFYRKSRFRAGPKDGGTFWLSDTPEVPGSKSWGNVIPRIATWLHLVEISSGKAFTVYNTHWDHQHQGSREKAAILLRQRIEKRPDPQSPVVMLGDFNAGENNRAIVALTAVGPKEFPTHFVEVFHAKNPDEKDRSTFNAWKNSRSGTNKIDHIFCSLPCKVASCSIVQPPSGENPPSDHFPLICQIQWE